MTLKEMILELEKFSAYVEASAYNTIDFLDKNVSSMPGEAKENIYTIHDKLRTIRNTYIYLIDHEIQELRDKNDRMAELATKNLENNDDNDEIIGV